MEKLFSFLANIHPLSAELQNYLGAIIKIRVLEKKDFLLKPGHTCRQMCFIESGMLRAFYLRGDSEVSAWFMKEGDVCVSIESFYTHQPSYEFIQAIEDTSLYYIDYGELDGIYKNFPEFNFIARVLTIRYLILWAQQLRAIRMQSVAERYHWLAEFHPELLQRVPQRFIASYLDCVPETLSRIRERMANP